MTPVKPIMGAYPYLRISNKFGVPYGDVLMLAEAARDNVPIEHGVKIRNLNISRLMSETCNGFNSAAEMEDFLAAMIAATDNFRDIQANGWDQSNG